MGALSAGGAVTASYSMLRGPSLGQCTPKPVPERLINTGASAAQPRVLVFNATGNKSGPLFAKFSYPRKGYNGRSWSIKDAGCVRIGSYASS
jgi:hypothetical protein